MKRCKLICFAVLLSTLPSIAQTYGLSDKVIVTKTEEPRNTLYRDELVIAQPKALTASVQVVGAGACGVANGRSYNGMLENPALLIHERKEIVSVAARIEATRSTFNTVAFLAAKENSVVNGTFTEGFVDAVDAYRNAETASERITAVDHINSYFGDIDEFVSNISGYPDPIMYGASLLPKISMQWKRFGLTVVGEGRAFLMSNPGSVLNGIASFSLETDSNGYIKATTRDEIERFVLTLIDRDGRVKPSALPTVFALGFADISTVVGYAHPLGDRFSLGVNLNYVTRLFASSVLSIHNYAYALRTAAGQLAHVNSNHVVTMDIGGLYQDSVNRFDIGVSLQNLIPLLTIEDDVNYFTNSESIEYHRDENGEIMVGYYDPETDLYLADPDGDTLVDYTSRQTNNIVPVKLKLPFIATVGGRWEATPYLNLSAEWKDIFANDVWGYEVYADRISLGAEIDFRDMFFFRTGLLAHRPTFGAGAHAVIAKRFNLGLDMAYAYDNFAHEMGLFAELLMSFRL